MSARKEREKKEYFTLGSYTTYRDFKRHASMTLDEANNIRKEALRIAEFRKTKIKFVTGSRLNAKRTTPSLPAEIWEEAINNILKPEK